MTTGLYSEAPESREKARKDIQADVVQVILPTEKSCNGEATVVNLKSDYLQLGDNNSIDNMNFGTINDEAVSDFLSSEPKSSDKSRTILRVLRRKSADKMALDVTDIETERINIRAKVIQIIPPSETSKQNSGKAPTIYLNVKDVVYVAQVGTQNHIYLPRQSLGVPLAKSPDPESNRFCLRVIRKPKSLLSGASRKRHPVELVYNINDDTQNDSTNLVQCGRYNTEVDARCDKNTGKVANTSCACQWETADVRPTEGYAKFWFRFYEPNAKYTLNFSLWHEGVPRETTWHDSKFERKLLDCTTVSLETGAGKTERRVSNTDTKNYHSTRNVKSPLIKDPNNAASSLPLSVAEVKVLCERFDQIMQILLPLRDNGEWKEFDEKAESLLERYTDVNTQAVICLEQAVAASYRNEMTRAEQVFRKAWGVVIAASDALIPLLKGRAFYYLAGIRRRAEKLGDAEKLIRSSKQFLEGSRFLLDLALLAYEEGSLLLRFMETSSCALKQSLFNEAKKKFDRCFQLKEQMRESEQNIYNLKHQFAVMKQAMLLLNSATKRFRDKCVDENSIKEATKCLDSIQTLMRLRLAQAQYCLVRADQYTRQHCYEAAESLSLEAWGLSRTCRFDTFEVANKQLRYIREIRSQ